MKQLASDKRWHRPPSPRGCLCYRLAGKETKQSLARPQVWSLKRTRIFTVEEANQTVEEISPLMGKVQSCMLQIAHEMELIASKTGSQPTELTPNELVKLSPTLRHLFEKLDRTVTEIESHGCYFKGLKLGLVDFPAILDGKEVFLCWQYGEEEVLFWHPVDTGFMGRQPLKGKNWRQQLH